MLSYMSVMQCRTRILVANNQN